MQLLIDNNPVVFEYGKKGPNWTLVFVMGNDDNGKLYRLQAHSIPSGVFNKGGKVFTAGHKYEVRKLNPTNKETI